MYKKTTLELWKKGMYAKTKISLFRNRKVLDIGCGDGEDSFNISKIASRVYAVDIAKNIKWDSYKANNLTLRVANAQKLPFPDNYFNGIYLKDVLHHVDYPKKVLSEIRRVTKKGSVIILVEGNRYNPIFYIHMTKMKGHEHLTFTVFKKIIFEKFNNVKFFQFESHYIPISNHLFFNLISKMIIFFFNIPLLNRFKSYNMAIIIK